VAQADRVWIIAVMHLKRHPGNLQIYHR